MKKLLIVFLIVLSNLSIIAQDLIIKRDFTEIKAVILKIGDGEITYNPYGFPEDYIKSIPISSVGILLYEDGRILNFGALEEPISSETKVRETTPEPAQETPNVSRIPTQTVESEVNQYETVRPIVSESDKPEVVDYSRRATDNFFLHRKHSYFSLAFGYGNSYGGLGMRLQGRVGGLLGIGFHGGIGYLPSATTGGLAMFGGGLKFYYYKGLYLNGQFGIFGQETYHEYGYYYYNGDYHYYSDYYEQKLYGPSILLGGDWMWGKKVGVGFNGALGISINVQDNTNFSRVHPALDLGFIIKF